MQHLKDNKEDILHRIKTPATKETTLSVGLLMINSKYAGGYQKTDTVCRLSTVIDMKTNAKMGWKIISSVTKNC